MPLGNAAVVIVSGGTLAIMLMENGLVASCVGEEESVTCTVKLDWPAPVGVPLIVPPLLKLRPAGNVPEVTVHAYGFVPPEAVSVDEYAVPTVPLGSEAELIVSGAPAALMPIESVSAAFCGGEDESVTCKVR
jgi:hypothetical protein